MFEFLSYTCGVAIGYCIFIIFLPFFFSGKHLITRPLSPSLLVYKPFKGALLSIWVRILGIVLASMFIFIYFYETLIEGYFLFLNIFIIDTFIYLFLLVLIIHSIIGLHHALRLKSLSGRNASILSEVGRPFIKNSSSRLSSLVYIVIIGFNNLLFIITTIFLLILFYFYLINLSL